MAIPPQFDVVVVGCGPVGAFAANLLGAAGLKTLVIEREAAPFPLPRAVHLDHEMMRLFQHAGVLDQVVPLMHAADGHIHIGADGGVIRYLGTVGRPKPFSFSADYFFYQPELEAALRDALEKFAQVDLRLGASFVGLRQDQRTITVEIEQDGRREEVTARYLIGADGARSAVRSALGVALDDLKFEEPWLVVDAAAEGAVQFPDFAGVPEQADLQRLSVMICDPSRPMTLVPGRGNHRRWEFMLLPDEDDQAMVDPETVAGLVAPWLKGVPHTIVRAATYRFHGLVAEQWRVGRAFLVGDAAHQTPPFFGQGMCHGLRDVANLAWKLALVIEGKADAGLLDTFQTERDAHVRSVIGAAVEAGRSICELDPERAAARDLHLRQLMAETGLRTAADLIPPILDGVVAPGAGSGVRFIQPGASGSDGQVLRLDDVTGGGWRLLLLGGPAPSLEAEAEAVWSRLGGRTFRLGVDFTEPEGHLRNWFETHGVEAVLLRPDFYVYGTAADQSGVSALVRGLAKDLGLHSATDLRSDTREPAQ